MGARKNIPGITVKGYSKQQRKDYMAVIKRNKDKGKY